MKKHLCALLRNTALPVVILVSFLSATPPPIRSTGVSSSAKFTIYVRLDYSSTWMYTTNGPNGCPFTEEHSDVTLRFFSDDLGTVPVSVSNLPVSLHHFYNFNASVSNSDFTVNGNGTAVLVDNDMLSFYDDGCDGNYSAENYYINDGPGYVIIY